MPVLQPRGSLVPEVNPQNFIIQWDRIIGGAIDTIRQTHEMKMDVEKLKFQKIANEAELQRIELAKNKLKFDMEQAEELSARNSQIFDRQKLMWKQEDDAENYMIDNTPVLTPKGIRQYSATMPKTTAMQNKLMSFIRTATSGDDVKSQNLLDAMSQGMEQKQELENVRTGVQLAQAKDQAAIQSLPFGERFVALGVQEQKAQTDLWAELTGGNKDAIATMFKEGKAQDLKNIFLTSAAKGRHLDLKMKMFDQMEAIFKSENKPIAGNHLDQDTAGDRVESNRFHADKLAQHLEGLEEAVNNTALSDEERAEMIFARDTLRELESKWKRRNSFGGAFIEQAGDIGELLFANIATLSTAFLKKDVWVTEVWKSGRAASLDVISLDKAERLHREGRHKEAYQLEDLVYDKYARFKSGESIEKIRDREQQRLDFQRTQSQLNALDSIMGGGAVQPIGEAPEDGIPGVKK